MRRTIKGDNGAQCVTLIDPHTFLARVFHRRIIVVVYDPPINVCLCVL